MPYLSPDLHNQIVQLCTPHFRLLADRRANLIDLLSGWEGYYQIDWSGSPHSFTMRLVEMLPPDRLQAVLRALLVGNQDEQKIEELCWQIGTEQGVLSAATQKSPQIAIQPVVSYPREAEVGKNYLMTVSVSTVSEGYNWPYTEEEFVLYCILDSEPFFTHTPIGEPAVILNRFGGTYGSATFLLTAGDRIGIGSVRISLINEAGIPIQVIELPEIVVAPKAKTIGKPSTDHAQLDQMRSDLHNTHVQLRLEPLRKAEGFHIVCDFEIRNGELLLSLNHDIFTIMLSLIFSGEMPVFPTIQALGISYPDQNKNAVQKSFLSPDVLSPDTFEELVRIIEPFVRFMAEREALLIEVFSGDHDRLLNQIDFTGSAQTFTTRLVRLIGNKQDAAVLLERLLTSIKFRMGIERQQRIDDILVTLTPAYKLGINVERASTVWIKNAVSQPTSGAVQEILIDLPHFNIVSKGNLLRLHLAAVYPDKSISSLIIQSPKLPDISLEAQLLHSAGADRLIPLTDKVFRKIQVRSDNLKVRQYCRTLLSELTAPRYQLDSRFVQLTLLLDQGPEAQGLRFVPDEQRRRYDNLKTLLADIDERFLVVLGPPGSGKTSLLRRLQHEQALSVLDTDTSVKIPFLVSLNTYRSNQPNDPLPDPYSWLADEWRIGYPDMPAFDELFEKGSFLLLLDGLNEMPHRNQEDYAHQVNQWRFFLQQAGDNTVVFSSRSLDHSVPLTSESAPVRQVVIEPLQPAQVEEFIRVYLKDSSQEVWEILKGNHDLLVLFSNPFLLRLLVEQFLSTGMLPSSRAGLFTGFVRRALHREVIERRTLSKPGELLHEADREQIIHNKWTTPFDLPSKGLLIPLLEKLAYAMQSGGQMTGTGLVKIPEKIAFEILEHPNSAEIISAGTQLNILDKDLSHQTISFLHQFVQEYFAARLFAQQPEPEKVFVPSRVDEIKPSLSDTLARLDVADPLPPPPSTGWEETVLLAAEMASDQEGFVNNLIAANLPLAARCAATSGVHISSKMRANIRHRLVERINDLNADLRARIVAAEALGEIGDPRFARQVGPHGGYLLPPLVNIKGGIYTIGDDKSVYDDEKPAHTVEITSFQIGAFPVTNAEFAYFVAAGGYEDKRWWQTQAAQDWLRGNWSREAQKAYYRDLVELLSGMPDDAIRQHPRLLPEQAETLLRLKKVGSVELDRQLDEWFPVGKVYRQPEFWNDSRFNQPSYPVVGVTWFEACAYCAWLSTQMGGNYRLPSEVEWEASGGGQDERIYPFGNEFDVGKCNTFETHIRRTTPVGVFPDGRSREGIADLSGNVSEWTISSYLPYPYQAEDGKDNETQSAVRKVVRGGSWTESATAARIKYRQHVSVGLRLHYIGFRVATLSQ
jgi:formylglycine-generating enzyme required for sulfatase activity